MNVTFLIGNGFDKALGLKTGYMDFYKWYVECSTANVPPCVCKFRREIKDFVCKDVSVNPYWADAEQGLANYTEQFSEDEIEDFLDCYEDFRNCLIEYLNNESTKISDNLAQRMSEKFTPQLFKFFQEVDPDRIDIFKKSRNVATSGDTLNVITFNYTKSIDKIFAALGSKQLGSWQSNDGRTYSMKTGILIHAHGYTDNYPIMGVCNSTTVGNPLFLNSSMFKSLMIKSESIKSSGNLWRREVNSTIKTSNIICIFGMSLGESDSDYWKLIVQWLKDSTDRQLIVFWKRENKEFVRTSIRYKRLEEDNVFNKLREYSEIQPDSFDNLKKQIHIVLHASKMFVLPEELKVKENASDILNEGTQNLALV